MFQRFRAWVTALFGKKAQQTDSDRDIERFEADYRRIDEINFAVIFGNRLSNIAFSDSTQDVTDAAGNPDGRRAQIVRGVLDWAFERARKIATQIMATGGRVLVPYVANGKVKCSVVAQERLYVIDADGDEITSAALLADSAMVNDKKYYRWTGYALENGNLSIRSRVTDEGGKTFPMNTVPAWADIPEEYAIANVERLPFAFMRCPADNRKEHEIYGAAITYGSDSIIAEIREHLKIIAREYRLTRPMLGLDSTLWRRRNVGTDGKGGVRGIDDVRKTVQDSDDPFIPVDGYTDDTKVPWMIFAPGIRDAAMYNRLDRLFEQLEKSVGTSRGILTVRETANATATEIRAANHDTFTMVTAIRGMWERGMDDLAYAVDMLAEHYGLSPAGARGDYSIDFDWDMSLFEASTESFQQLTELHDRHLISGAELRQWVRGGTLEEAQAAIDEIGANEGNERENAIDRLIGQMRTGDEME